MVGTFLVYVPAAIYLISIGSVGRAIFLLVWGGLVGALSDNVMKPLIIKGGARIHPVVIFFSILGGLTFFGFSGLILGPLITAMTFVFFELLPGTMKLSRDQIEAALRENPDTEGPR